LPAEVATHFVATFVVNEKVVELTAVFTVAE
jgi:hypothetical protein